MDQITLRRDWMSLVGAMGTMLATAGRELEEWYLRGVTGHAFRLTLDAVLSPGAPFELDFAEALRLWQNLGVWLTRTAARPDEDRFAEARLLALARVRESVAKGWPAVLFDLLDLPEYGLVVGCAEERLRCLTLANPDEAQWMATADWPPQQRRAWTRVDAITMTAIDPAFDRRRAEVASLRFAVDHFWAPPARDLWTQHGQKAYQYWLAVLESTLPLHGPSPATGHSFNLAVLTAARKDAVTYLRHLAAAYPEAPSLKAAATAYQAVADALTGASTVLPFPSEGTLDQEQRTTLAGYLAAALAAERTGIDAIEAALRPLR